MLLWLFVNSLLQFFQKCLTRQCLGAILHKNLWALKTTCIQKQNVPNAVPTKHLKDVCPKGSSCMMGTSAIKRGICRSGKTLKGPVTGIHAHAKRKDGTFKPDVSNLSSSLLRRGVPFLCGCIRPPLEIFPQVLETVMHYSSSSL